MLAVLVSLKINKIIFRKLTERGINLATNMSLTFTLIFGSSLTDRQNAHFDLSFTPTEEFVVYFLTFFLLSYN